MKKSRDFLENSKKEAAKILARIEILDKEIVEIHAAMAADNMDYEELIKYYSRKVDLSKELDVLMDIWLSFGE